MDFTYYTIIGKDASLFENHIKNVKEYAGFDKLPCEKEFVAIIYKNAKIPDAITDRLLEICKEYDIRPEIYNEPTTDFLTNLYYCWNRGYEVAKDGYVFRAGSDQVFSKDSFLALWKQVEATKGQKIILQANTIENYKRLREIGAHSRHFECDFGDNFENFNYSEFETFIEVINKRVKDKELIDIETSLKAWKRPGKLQTSLGSIDRVDGCSWGMTKEEATKYWTGNPLVNGITLDVRVHDNMQLDGYKMFIVKDLITYHFVRGESMEKY
jgi:hypothetical protein